MLIYLTILIFQSKRQNNTVKFLLISLIQALSKATSNVLSNVLPPSRLEKLLKVSLWNSSKIHLRVQALKMLGTGIFLELEPHPHCCFMLALGRNTDPLHGEHRQKLLEFLGINGIHYTLHPALFAVVRRALSHLANSHRVLLAVTVLQCFLFHL